MNMTRKEAYMDKRKIMNLIIVALFISVFVVLLTDTEPAIGLWNEGMNLTDSLEVYVDDSGEFQLEDVMKSESQLNFQTYGESKVSSSMSDAHYWVRLDLAGVAEGDDVYMLEISKPHLSHVQFYQVSAAGDVIKSVLTGRAHPFASREINHRNFVFLLDSDHMDGKVYMDIQTNSYLQVPATLWTKTGFIQVSNQESLGYGAFYGILLVMVLYNGFLALTLRDKSYLYYVLFVMAFGVLQLIWDGYSYQYLWPGASQWDLLANPFFINMSGLFLILFNSAFLGVRKTQKLLHLTYIGFVGVALVAIAAVFVLPVHTSIYISMMLMITTLVLSILAVYFNHAPRRSHRIYFVAWSTLFIANTISVLAGLKLIPFSTFSLHAPKIGVIALVVLFSLALSDRIQHAEYLKGIEAEKGLLLKNLHDMNKKITSTREIQQVFEYLLKDFQAITPFESTAIVMEEPGMKRSFRRYDQNGNVPVKVAMTEDEYKAYRMNFNGEDALVPSQAFLECFKISGDVLSVLAIPLVNRGHRMGFILLYSYSEQKIHEQVKTMLVDYASQIAITIDNIRLLNEVTHVAEHDGLTQVYNRKTLFDKARKLFNQPLEDGGEMAAIMLDFDHFKEINDQYGHSAGDRVLQQVAKIMVSQLGDNGMVGRYGGEEFIVILPETTRKKAQRIGESIRSIVERTPILIQEGQNKHINITISAGIAYKNEKTKTIYALTEEADQALYEAKSTGRNRVVESTEVSNTAV